MAHRTLKNGYSSLVERLNRFPQGAPPSELLFRILSVLFSEKEAALVALLPLRPFDAATAARLWKLNESEAIRLLEDLASRGMILDMERDEGGRVFTLPPPMAGFFEFSMMRVGDRHDQRLLAELYYQYLNVEEDFVRCLFAGGETELGRVFVNERALAEGALAVGTEADRAPAGRGSSGRAAGPDTLQVLDYERASEVIRSATHRGVGTCYCRHKMSHLGKACDAPLDICMTFNGVASSLVKHGVARGVDVAEGLDLLDEAVERGLVQFGENVRESVSFVCNCCGCCCEALLAAKRFAVLNPVATTNYLPAVASASCTGCGKCAEACPVEAMGLVSASDPKAPRRKKARVDESLCLGCGVCVRACPAGALSLAARGARILTPVNSAHRAVLMAIERGKLQNLVFDNQALASHRAMAAVLGVILSLPPAKRLMASRQMKSRYLERLLSRKAFIREGA
ncbi:MAG: 4Fe-4S dicluster domain-containing protein [Spirochaetaceae bacterium]|nr:4Fe-4S dicluster domain-containing protein [Spirochaetaceae bacterium]